MTTAALVTAYWGVPRRGDTPPLPEGVLTTCPLAPEAIMVGTKALIPWMMPYTLTLNAQRQSLSSCSHDRALGSGADARVVAEEMDGAEVLQGCIPQLLHRGEVGDVALHADDLQAVGPELADGVGQRVVVHVGQNDLHPFAGESLSHGASDAPGPPGDHRHLPGKILDHSDPAGDMSS